MATPDNQLISATSSSWYPKWDVFLSFRGTDTRRNIVSHLYTALHNEGIETFKDNLELQKGEEISWALRTAIHDSAVSIVIISKNYASSAWCLNELLDILDCKRTNGQLVIPVFWYVDPSDVRHQKGSFGEAIEKHNKRYELEILEKWISALVEIADMSGHHLKEDTDEEESSIVHQIVAQVASQASPNLSHHNEHLFGMDVAVEEIYKRMRMQSNEVLALGIWGMGGIGKTTTARTFFDKYSKDFDKTCFVEDIKPNSKSGITLLEVIERLLIKLGSKKEYNVPDVAMGIKRLKGILGSKKLLMVLDDLDESIYWELLVRLCNSFSAGSRIVVTTRDKDMLTKLGAQMPDMDIYELKKLEQEESLKLFSYHAFGKKQATKVLRELAIEFSSYAGGLPLALKVLGSSLCGRPSVSFWKGQLRKLRQIPNMDIQKVLRLSYDELGDEEKAIFLYTVFFFVGKDKDEAVQIFDSCDFFPDTGVPILEERCLLAIDKENKFRMHNLIQDMGMVVIREESEHGKCRHLTLGEENPCKALQNLKEMDKIEALILDLSTATNRQLNVEIFEKLSKLRLVHIIGPCYMNGSFKNIFHELRCIRWHYCPGRCLPSDLRPERLVSLEMPNSEFTTLWKGAMSLVNLQILNVSGSKHLKATPNFGNAKKVEKLLFRDCTSLQKVHPTIGELSNLKHLVLYGCKQLIELPETIGHLTKLDYLCVRHCVNLTQLPEPITQLTNLSCLEMDGCLNVKRLPEQLGDMKVLKELSACDTGIEKLPDSITQIKGLVQLYLSGCKNLTKLPEQFGDLEGLERFGAGDTALEELPDSFVCLNNLVYMSLSSCENLINLPDGIGKLKLLKEIYLGYCSKLKRLPEDIGKLPCLEQLCAYYTALEKLPDSIGQLGSLQRLSLDHCGRLTCLPDSIGNLTSLVLLSLQGSGIIKLPDTAKSMKLRYLSSSSIELYLPVIPSLSCLEELCLSDEGHGFSSTKPFSLSQLLNLKRFSCKNFGSSLPELPLNIKELVVEDASTLEQLPDLSSYKQLWSLKIRRCISLQVLPLLPPHLRHLVVYKCKSLQNPSDRSLLNKLRYLGIVECSSVKSVCLEERLLQLVPGHEFKADIPNEKIPEWFDYQCRGCTLSFNFPPILEDTYFDVALWVVYKIINIDGPQNYFRALVTNETQAITNNYDMFPPLEVGIVQSSVECLSRNFISLKGGDKITISFCYYDIGEVKVEMCGVHVRQKPSPAPS